MKINIFQLNSKLYRDDEKSSLFLYNLIVEFIEIGKIVNTFGIRGELKVDYSTDFIDERFKKDTTVYIGEDKIPFVMKNHRIHKGFLLISFKDNEDINLVEKYKNMYIYKSKDDVKPLKDGEYYFSDLRDLDVYVEDKIVGKVLRVEEGIRNNNLRILVGDVEKLVPYLPVFVRNVDLKNHKIVINNIEGLLWKSQY